ncbi:hypothetical protein ACTFIU_010251 [Dictyostelium citrinum]
MIMENASTSIADVIFSLDLDLNGTIIENEFNCVLHNIKKINIDWKCLKNKIKESKYQSLLDLESIVNHLSESFKQFEEHVVFCLDKIEELSKQATKEISLSKEGIELHHRKNFLEKSIGFFSKILSFLFKYKSTNQLELLEIKNTIKDKNFKMTEFQMKNFIDKTQSLQTSFLNLNISISTIKSQINKIRYFNSELSLNDFCVAILDKNIMDVTYTRMKNLLNKYNCELLKK